MASNRGETTLRLKRSASDPMREFDRLPRELRTWIAGANLPWRPRSVSKAYARALLRTGDPAQALAALDDLQQRLIAVDAARIWGSEHPAADGLSGVGRPDARQPSV